MNDSDDLLTTAQAAAMVRRKPSTLRVWRYRQVGPRHTTDPMGRAWYRRDDLAKWLSQNTTHHRGEAA